MKSRRTKHAKRFAVLHQELLARARARADQPPPPPPSEAGGDSDTADDGADFDDTDEDEGVDAPTAATAQHANPVPEGYRRTSRGVLVAIVRVGG